MTTQTLRITSAALHEIKAVARASAARECMGLLTSAADGQEITGAYLLDAETSASHAEAAPQALKNASQEIRQRHLIARGMWHSHGKYGVFHSSVDDATIYRLLPAMAESNFDYSARPTIPQLLGPTTAVLPVQNGHQLRFCLAAESDRGPFAPSTAWQGIRVESSDIAEPVATHRVDSLELAGGGIALILGLPKSCQLLTANEERSGGRLTRLYSIVVNERGDAEAKCLLVGEIEAETFMRLAPCEIVAIEDATPARTGGFLPLAPFSQAA